jgi:hypothetical protein
MSKIYVAEYVDLAGCMDGSVAIMPEPPTVEYQVIVSAASSGAATPFLPSTKFIEVSTDTTCSIVIGLFPGVIGTGTALLTNKRLFANERLIMRVPPAVSPQMTGNSFTAPARYAIFTTANV